MSGGSYDYLYGKVEDMASSLAASRLPIRRAFAKHLNLIARAMHDIEWVDSCDYAEGDEIEAIEKVLGDNCRSLEMKEVMIEANEILEKLQALISANTGGNLKKGNEV